MTRSCLSILILQTNNLCMWAVIKMVVFSCFLYGTFKFNWLK